MITHINTGGHPNDIVRTLVPGGSLGGGVCLLVSAFVRFLEGPLCKEILSSWASPAPGHGRPQ